MKTVSVGSLGLCLLLFIATHSPRAQSPDAFTVRKQQVAPGPRITPYLQYQVDQAWRQDAQRLAALSAIRSESDLQGLRAKLRAKLLAMMGGLPERKTALNARVTGAVRLTGHHIEKIVFESLPGFHVTALLYVPDMPAGPKPAVLVPCGHSANGKFAYQYIGHRLARRGYIAICWDPVGQGERSQFWDEGKRRSRYNLVCGEHAVLGNLAYLAGANLARWEIWDGIRAVDYLLSRPEVDPRRISITGTSGGGFQASHIGALDERIKVVVPSCYISSLPMRMNNRIFKDPDSDPEQDLFRMVSDGVDHAGLLLLVYPRPLFIAAAVEDFFPIEGTRKTFREVSAIYERFGHRDRIAMVEGYHGHKYSPENLEAAFGFMDRFNEMPRELPFPPDEKLDDKMLQCTRSGQVLLDIKDGRPLLDLIREYYLERKGRLREDLGAIYRGAGYPAISEWQVVPYDGAPPQNRIAWETMGSSRVGGLAIDRYLLHHSEQLAIPLLHIHTYDQRGTKAVLWFGAQGKAGPSDWNEVNDLAGQGYQVFSFDFRGLGEDRMNFQAMSMDDPTLGKAGFDEAYLSPISGVLANYVYNSLLTGRPYFLQMIEDAEIVSRFARDKVGIREAFVKGQGEAYTLAAAVAEAIPAIKLIPSSGERRILWSELVGQKRELWPVYYLLPGGAYIR